MKRLALLLGLIFMVSPFSFAEEVQPTEATKGCLMSFCTMNGVPMYQFFVKVADDEYDDPDTGEHQIWGFDPLNKHLDKKGNIIFQRVHEKDFLKAGKQGMKAGQPCVFRCPLW